MKRTGIVLFGVLAACAPGREEPPPETGAASTPPVVPAATASAPTSPLPALPATSSTSCRIASDAIGPLRLGLTLEAVRASHPQVAFSRTSDGEGVALVEVATATDGESLAIAYTGEEGAEAPVDMARPIEHLETFSAACATAEGIRPGSTVEEAEAAYGPVLAIQRSEIESREYVEFARQPPGLQFRLDYSGEFAEGQSETTRRAPGAKLFSIAVSRR